MTDEDRARAVLPCVRGDFHCVAGHGTDGRMMTDVVRALREVRAEERERCARVAETQYRRDQDGIDSGWVPIAVRSRVEKRIAAEIRRGEG